MQEQIDLLQKNNLLRYFNVFNLGICHSLLNNNNIKYLKFRLCDHFYCLENNNISRSDEFLQAWFNVNESEFESHNISHKLLNLPFNFHASMKIENFIYPIVGHYVIKDTLVFCSYPNIETIKKAFKNDNNTTFIKLQYCYRLSNVSASDFLFEISRI